MRLLAYAAPFSIAMLAGVMLVVALCPPRVGETPFNTVLEVTDMKGSVVRLHGTPKSAMIFPPVLWHYVTVDGDTHVSAISQFLKEETAGGLLGKLFPSLAEKEEALTTRGATPATVEQTMLEQPDVVLVWAWLPDRLEEIRYPGLVKLVNDESLCTEDTYRVFGDLTQRSEAVRTLLARCREHLNEIYGQVPRRAYPPELLVMNPWNFFMWGKSSPGFSRDMRWLGARNVAEMVGSNGDQLSVEELIRLDPEVILLPTYAQHRSSPADVYADNRLTAIRAVRDRRVYRLPNGAARMDGAVEAPLLAQWIAELIYPGITFRVPLRNAIRDAYREAYAYEMSDDDIDALLRLDENAISASYERFARENRPGQ
ncbi:MAG: ABC transporter substrate-binding protein [Gammaproteobacteria bacterium]